MFAVADAAVNHGDAQIGEAAVIAKGGLNLRRKFPCRFQNEAAKIAVLGQQRQDRQSECRGFAGAGLGGTDQIFARKNNRERAQLDRRRLLKAHGLRPAHHFGRKVEIIE